MLKPEPEHEDEIPQDPAIVLDWIGGAVRAMYSADHPPMRLYRQNFYTVEVHLNMAALMTSKLGYMFTAIGWNPQLSCFEAAFLVNVDDPRWKIERRWPIVEYPKGDPDHETSV